MDATIRFGPYRLHPAQGLYSGGAEVRLTPKSLAVLCVLAKRPREVVTKAELFAAVWPSRVVSDAALSSCIRELRRALGDDARNPRYIETVHRRGFRLCAPCIAARPRLDTGDGERLAAGDPRARARADCERAVTAGQPASSCRHGRGVRTAQTGHHPADCSASGSPSIVVLPFENVSGEEPAAVLARGLAHDITTQVARSRTMLIIARGTAFQFTGGRHDVRRVGRKLGVRYVAQGAVQVSGARLKVSVALADTQSREELWSEQYERKLDDWALLQQEIAELIVASLELEVQREEARRALLVPSSNLDAWSAYHRGLHHMYRFKQDDCAKAEHWFGRSIEMEADVPRPYAGLSFINFERAFLNFDRDRLIRIQRAFDYAVQSLAIDPRDPMGHWALSRAHLLRGELEEAKESVETAIELNPSYAIAQYSLGWIALQLGENQLCLERVGFARRLSPYDPLKFAMLGVFALNLALMGRTAEAAELSLRSTRQVNAHHQALAFAAVTHALDGQLARAVEFFGRVRTISPGYDLKDFLAVFPFRRERDLARVRKAFDDVRKLVV